MELVNIYKNGKEFHIEAEKAQEYCEKYGFSLTLQVGKKKAMKNDNNDSRLEKNQIRLR